MGKNFQYIYGPVYSWRLGVSLGIDPLSGQDKICNFDCIYCQLGKTHHLESKRGDFVSVEAIMEEIDSLPKLNIDHFTFSGRGEPTLAKNLGEMIQALKGRKKGKIAVITNSGLMDHRDVREDLFLADYVIAKLDAHNQETLVNIDKTMQDIKFEDILSGIKSFRRSFKGKLAIQVMFIDQNKAYAQYMADIVREIAPHEVQIDTPLRASKLKPLGVEEINEIKKYFKGLPVSCVYDVPQKEIEAMSGEETARRHGRVRKNLNGNQNVTCQKEGVCSRYSQPRQ